MWKFLQPPPGLPTTSTENTSQYEIKRNDWNTDIHLIGTYIFFVAISIIFDKLFLS